MAGKKNTSLDRVLGRLDSLDSVNLANLVQRLARERGLFEEIFNTLQEGVLVIDPEGTIEYANESAHSLIGVSEDDLEGGILWKFLPGLRPSMGTAMEPEDGGSPVIASREFELTYPKPRTLRLYMVPFRAGTREVKRRYVVILSDITRDKEATGQRIEDERTSSILLLAGGVAHELGNPLNSLTIHLQLMERKLKKLKANSESDSIAESVKICRDEVQRLDGIIKNFLEAIRPQVPDLSETNLADVLSEVLKVQKQEIADRGIVIEAEASASLPVVMADKNQIKQVFFNLTKNAMEAMQPGGKLRIRSGIDDESVYLLIGDSGTGIKQDDLVKLFQPYHTTKTGGHGLGLMIVQRIMRAHGGQVGIESKEGVGTVVTLQFPRKDKRVRMLHGGI
ncbi:MAG: ATP-binding protein [Verrucomicrobiota bacterium]|jgi:PAS domain S-box-containing protein|nr:MAG: PAS domain-containing protein [Verrucomicrobiota bacterium]